MILVSDKGSFKASKNATGWTACHLDDTLIEDIDPQPSMLELKVEILNYLKNIEMLKKYGQR